tara:strand:+ start:141 stop:722 length:582 start_codon:yes stop_codon:yes gene_type:complete
MLNKEKTKLGEWVIYIILITLTCLGLLSCTPDPLWEDHSKFLLNDEENYTPQAFIVKNEQYQEIYLDTLQSDTYFTLVAEANKMPERYCYNGEYNIWASFSTPNYYNDGTSVTYIDNIPYVSSNSVRFDAPREFNGKIQGYQPKTLDLYARQNVGPIHKSAIKQRDTIAIYMDVTFDDEWFVRDTLFVVLRSK